MAESGKRKDAPAGGRDQQSKKKKVLCLTMLN